MPISQCNCPNLLIVQLTNSPNALQAQKPNVTIVKMSWGCPVEGCPKALPFDYFFSLVDCWHFMLVQFDILCGCWGISPFSVSGRFNQQGILWWPFQFSQLLKCCFKILFMIWPAGDMGWHSPISPSYTVSSDPLCSLPGLGPLVSLK